MRTFTDTNSNTSFEYGTGKSVRITNKYGVTLIEQSAIINFVKMLMLDQALDDTFVLFTLLPD